MPAGAMGDTPDWHERWATTHQEMVICFRERRFQDAADLLENARRRALESNTLEEAASYSGLLSSCLATLKRDEDALAASEEAERLAPGEPHYAVRSADLLLNYLNNPVAALAKLERLLQGLSPNDPSRYHATSLLGQAKLAVGETEVAIGLFREITSPEEMERLRRAEYAGVYDLGLVQALIKRRLAPEECRNYLAAVREVAAANGSVYVVEDVDRLMDQLQPPA